MYVLSNPASNHSTARHLIFSLPLYPEMIDCEFVLSRFRELSVALHIRLDLPLRSVLPFDPLKPTLCTTYIRLPIQDGLQVNTLRAADEILRRKAARKPVGFPEATACGTTIGSISASCPSVSMLERAPPMTTPVADGSGSPFSSKMAAYRRVLPRRSETRARLPCMICLGVQARGRA
ncbi:hypothetical protein BJV74DRAFT_46711 [Russula compacta]|nr:hypothetical protein BJV74DRAFT_46711 [Russula compacta]